VLVCADDGRVQDQPFQVGVLQSREDALPDSLLGPTVEPFPDVVPVPEAFGQVAPGGTGLGDPEYGIDKQPVILGDAPMLAGTSGQQVLDPIPVGVRNGMAVVHRGPSVA